MEMSVRQKASEVMKSRLKESVSGMRQTLAKLSEEREKTAKEFRLFAPCCLPLCCFPFFARITASLVHYVGALHESVKIVSETS
jgi:hypothetical protein